VLSEVLTADGYTKKIPGAIKAVKEYQQQQQQQQHYAQPASVLI